MDAPVADRSDAPPVRGDARFVRDPPTRQRVGIALSGGGIRSATFGLGVLQVLRKRGVLDQTDFVAAVSGGNYIATAHTIVAAKSDPALFAAVPPFAENSPEERWFRQHSTYLAPDLRGRVLLILNIAYGAVANYLPFLLWVVLAGRLTGWAYSAGLQEELSGSVGYGHAEIDGDEVGIVLGLLAAAIVLTGLRRHTAERRWRASTGRLQRGLSIASVVAASLAALAAALLIVVPQLVVAQRWAGNGLRVALGVPGNREITGGTPIELLFGAEISPSTLGLVAVAGAVTVLVVVVARRIGPSVYLRALGWVAAFLLLGVPYLVGVSRGAALGFNRSDTAWLLAGAAIVLFFAICMHNARYSMHPFYRERLSTVFAIRRVQRPDGTLAVEQLAYGEPLYFSHLGPDVPPAGNSYFPQLVVCAAVNLSGDDVPPGRLAASYTFEYDYSGFDADAREETGRLEAFDGNRGVLLTLPGLMAISGAAVSPMMGKLTLRPLRLALALANIRLGVWLPNPNATHQARERPVATARGATPPPAATGRRSAVVRAAQWIARGWDEPGAWYVLREGLGWMDKRSRYLYVTDGGHWDNLGLVELLRRRCNRIICFDATNGTDGLEAISQALALAAAELSVEIELTRSQDLLVDDDGLAATCVTEGRVWYPDGSEGRLVVAKSVVTADMPADVVGFRRRDRRFPNHSTGDQLFDDEEFEAYRSLGRVVAGRAADALNLRHEKKRRPASRVHAEPLPDPSGEPVVLDAPAATHSRWRRHDRPEPVEVAAPPAARSSR